eukprot:7153976-Prymnesium_polylepis.2
MPQVTAFQGRRPPAPANDSLHQPRSKRVSRPAHNAMSAHSHTLLSPQVGQHRQTVFGKERRHEANKRKCSHGLHDWHDLPDPSGNAHAVEAALATPVGSE